MAIEIGNIPALDNEPAVGIGIGIPFSSYPISGSDAVFKINYTTSEQIRSNIINYLLTSKGERILNPNFGSNLKEFLFEQSDSESPQVLVQYLKDTLASVFPNVKVKKIEAIPSPEYNLVTIQIFYSVFTSVNEFIELNIPL